MVIDCSIIHFRSLERIGTEITRSDKRFLDQIRLNDRNSGIHRAANQQKEQDIIAFHSKDFLRKKRAKIAILQIIESQ